MEPTKENIENTIKLNKEESDSKPPLLYYKKLSIFWKEFSQNRESIFKIIYNILEGQKNDDINEEIKKNKNTIDFIEELFNEEENESKESEEESKEVHEENFKKNNIKRQENLENEIELLKLRENEKKKIFEIGNKINENYYNNFKKNYNNNLELYEYGKLKLIEMFNVIYLSIDDDIILFPIEFLFKVNIVGSEEWICNAEYLIYICYYIKNLKFPYFENKNININNKIYYSTLTNVNNVTNYLLIYGNNNVSVKEKCIDVTKIINSITSNKIKNEVSNNYLKLLFNDQLINDYYLKLNKKFDLINEFSILFNNIIHSQSLQYRNCFLIFHHNYKFIHIHLVHELAKAYLSNYFRYLYLDIKTLKKYTSSEQLRYYFSYWIHKIFNIEDLSKNENYFNEEISQNLKKENYLKFILFQVINKNKEIKKSNFNKLYIIFDNITDIKDYYYISSINNELQEDHYFDFQLILFCDIESKSICQFFFSNQNLYNYKKDYNIYYINLIDEAKNINEDELLEMLNSRDNEKLLSEFVSLFHFKEHLEKEEAVLYFNLDLNYLINYIKYIKLIIKQNNNEFKLLDIEFKNDEIEKMFLKYYNSIVTKFINTKRKINSVFGKDKGNSIENQIVYDTMTGKIENQNFSNIKFVECKVNSLYCLKIKEQEKLILNNNEHILFTQKSATGEIYDFAFLINNKMKLFQNTTLKTSNDLKKLERLIIEVDCENIKRELFPTKQVEDFTFGIITTKEVFNEFKNLKKPSKKHTYYLMRKFCLKNNYEFFIYDLYSKTIYIDIDGELIEYKNLYEFNNSKKIVTTNFETLYNKGVKKISTKYVEKEKINKFISTKLSLSYVRILAKYTYKKELKTLNFNENNYGIFIYGYYKSKNQIILFKGNSLKIPISESNIENDSSNWNVVLFYGNPNNEIIDNNNKENFNEEGSNDEEGNKKRINNEERITDEEKNNDKEGNNFEKENFDEEERNDDEGSNNEEDSNDKEVCNNEEEINDKNQNKKDIINKLDNIKKLLKKKTNRSEIKKNNQSENKKNKNKRKKSY